MGLLLGLIITLAAVIAYSAYITWQVAGLRRLQAEMIDRNRRDSLQLLRIQNDLNLLAVAMRDMIDNDEPYPLTAWSVQFQRIRTDLDDAMHLEAALAPAGRTPEQSASLTSSLTQFWDAVDRVFALAGAGQDKAARQQIQLSLQARQAGLSTAVARLLVQNSENEEQAAQRIVQIYDRVQRAAARGRKSARCVAPPALHFRCSAPASAQPPCSTPPGALAATVGSAVALPCPALRQPKQKPGLPHPRTG